MAIIPVNIENLKPNKEYIVTVRAKNNDINVMSEYTDSVRFVTPTDSTIPNAPTNLILAASFLNVLFTYTYSTDDDAMQYEYELYKQDQIQTVDATYQIISGQTPYSTGLVQTNVFLVSVDDNSTTTSTSSVTNPVKYYGRIRTIDSAGNISDWTAIVASGDTPLIDEEFIGSLTAAKITAGTIGAHEITLDGPNSIIKSSNFDGEPVGSGSYANATEGWLINGQGKAYFYDATVVGSIDIGGFDSGSFHVNTSGDMWLGAGTYGAAPFRVSREGLLEISAGTGSTIGGQLIDVIAESVIDFNARNNRNATTPTAPTTLTGGNAIDHTANTDGSVNISFEWDYTYSDASGVANNIDGFIVYLYSSTSSSPYTFGTTTSSESTYPLNYDQRAIIFSGLAADRYYTFGVRAYRVVDSDIDSNQILYSAIVKSSVVGENPYQPSSTVEYTGNIAGTLASTVVSYANAGNTVATNFNANNDRNSTTPTAPTIASDTTAIDHVLNTDGSADISFEWSYTTSDTYNAANNIDGFIVYVRSSQDSASSYTFGTTVAEETTYYLPRDKRAFILPAVAADRYYNFGVRAYRMVDTDVASGGIVYSSIIQSTGSGENPYRPSSSVAFAGNITGTLNGTAVATVVSYANAGNTVATNFNANNDRNSTTPTAPTIASDTTAIDHVLNTDGSADISFEWSYTTSDTYNAANNIDGFIVYVRSSTSASSYTFGTTVAEETTYYLPRDKRAFILPAVAADRYYNFGVRAYRMVDTDVASGGIVYSAIVKSSVVGENPYQPSSTVEYTGNIAGTLASTVVSYANAGNTVATNFNANNDRNSTTPTAPTIASDTTAIDHVLNTDGSADISFEWSYTTSDTYNAANNIDGFIVYVRSSQDSASSYTFGTTVAEETTYYLPRDKRAFILPAVAADRYYNFGVRAYRMVDTDVASGGIVYSSIIQSTGSGENPYRPSSLVAFAGNITGTLNGTAVATVVSYANAGNTVATNFNANNDRNSTTPTAPTIASDTTAIDHVLNTDGSADISFEWSYTTSDTYNAANNIDGFIVYVRSSQDSASSYTFGTTVAEETTYYLPRDKRAFILPAVAADRYYNFGVRAYRMVDTDVASGGIVYSSIIQSTGSGENPYRPSSLVAFAGNITGTLNGTAVATVVSYANAGNTVATNFNANNDRNSTTPTAPTIASDTTAIDHVLNTDGSADISFEWSYTTSDTYNAANNIDGFIVYVRSSQDSASSYTFGTTVAEETTYYLPRDKRAFILPAVAADRYYNFGVRAYRMVDTDVASGGIVYSSIIQSTGSGENPYRPSANVAFAGDITGTVNSVSVITITTGVSNFNNNNDRKSTTPATPTSVAFSAATSNTNASIDLPLTWAFTGSGDAYDIDGFVVFLRTTTATDSSSISTSDLNTNIQQVYLTAEKRSHTFSGISPNSFYRAAIRAYRVVDTDINAAGVIYGSLANTTERSSTTAVLGGSTGISIGAGKIYIGTGTYNNSNTGFYVDSSGQFSLKDKLSWNGTTLTVNGVINATSGTFSGTITASGTISGGTITGATITGTTLTTASSGSRVNINTNDITLYYGADNLASLKFDGNSLYTNDISSTGTIRLVGLNSSGNNYVKVGYHPAGIYSGVTVAALDGVRISGGNDSTTGILGHLVVSGSAGTQANLTLLNNSTHVQLRTADNDNTLYIRRANDSAYCNVNGGVYTNASSRRYKENIVNIYENNMNILNKILNLNVVQFNYKDDAANYHGLIAEDAYEVFPEIVSLNSNNEPEGIKTMDLLAFLIAAVQELNSNNANNVI